MKLIHFKDIKERELYKNVFTFAFSSQMATDHDRSSVLLGDQKKKQLFLIVQSLEIL